MNEQSARAAQDLRLIVENLVNGVPASEVARAFGKSPEAVEAVFAFALRKIRSYCFERALPAFVCNGIGDARGKRVLFLFLLERVNLTVDPKFGRIRQHTIDEDNLNEFVKGIR